MLAVVRVAPRAASRGAAFILRRPLAGRARRPKRRIPAKPPPKKAPETSKPPPWAGWWKDETPPDGESVGRTLWGLAKFGFYFWGVTTYVVDLTLCTGPSMEPTLNANSDLVLLDRVSPRLGRIATGDIVVADSPTRPGETVCKRVAAVAGASRAAFSPTSFPRAASGCWATTAATRRTRGFTAACRRTS